MFLAVSFIYTLPSKLILPWEKEASLKRHHSRMFYRVAIFWKACSDKFQSTCTCMYVVFFLSGNISLKLISLIPLLRCSRLGDKRLSSDHRRCDCLFCFCSTQHFSREDCFLSCLFYGSGSVITVAMVPFS